MSTRLAEKIEPNLTRVIAVTSGKGGVGKTTVSINLATALAQSGHDVVLMDADLGLANVDVMLGLSPTHTLQHVISGECTLTNIMLPGPAGFRILPAASGIPHMAELSANERAGLLYAFSNIEQPPEVLVVDTAAGIATNALQFCNASQEVIVVVCNEPASITDAYATIKVIHQSNQRRRFRILVNQCESEFEALELFNRLVAVTDRFLDVTLELVGAIPFDLNIKASLQRRNACVATYPNCAAALAFKKLADTADKWPMPDAASGELEFFLERIIERDKLGRRVHA